MFRLIDAMDKSQLTNLKNVTNVVTMKAYSKNENKPVKICWQLLH